MLLKCNIKNTTGEWWTGQIMTSKLVRCSIQRELKNIVDIVLWGSKTERSWPLNKCYVAKALINICSLWTSSTVLITHYPLISCLKLNTNPKEQHKGIKVCRDRSYCTKVTIRAAALGFQPLGRSCISPMGSTRSWGQIRSGKDPRTSANPCLSIPLHTSPTGGWCCHPAQPSPGER